MDEDISYFDSPETDEYRQDERESVDDDKADRTSWIGKLGADWNNGRAPSNIDDSSEAYVDNFNDESWKCSFGTHEDDGIWLNLSDRVGTIMAALVWVLIAYSVVTIGLLTQHHHVPQFVAAVYATICALALASHAKTTFTDPGAVPSGAVPVHASGGSYHTMCSHCQSFKPVCAHHCRICDRCVSRMDHHCPWMNNCIGGGNMSAYLGVSRAP